MECPTRINIIIIIQKIIYILLVYLHFWAKCFVVSRVEFKFVFYVLYPPILVWIQAHHNSIAAVVDVDDDAAADDLQLAGLWPGGPSVVCGERGRRRRSDDVPVPHHQIGTGCGVVVVGGK